MVPDLRTLDPAAVAAEQAVLLERARELEPRIDGRGAVGDVLLHLAAAIAAGMRAEVDELARLSSVKALLEDPTAVSEAALEAVLSNYRVERRGATAASGRVRVTVDSAVPLVVPAGVMFSSGGVPLSVARPVAVRSDASQVTSDDDVVLETAAGGLFGFSVPVTAAVAGSAGLLRQDAAVTPLFPVAGLVDARAEGDFAGGADAESAAELVARFRAGLAPQAFSNRAGIEALIRSQAAFAPLVGLSIVGAGDREMRRDKHALLPVSLFGRCDIYARTEALPAAVPVTLEATLVDIAAGVGIWQATLSRDAAPGFYEVTRIARPGAAVPAELQSIAPGYDISGMDAPPDVASAEEAAFSPLATAVLRFADSSVSTVGLTVGSSKLSYEVSASRLPRLADLQAFMSGRSVAAPGGDTLVRAPVPVFLALEVTVARPQGIAMPDSAAVAAAVSAVVNATRFPGRLHASQVIAAAQPSLPAGCWVASVDLLGRLLRPDGSTTYLHSREALVVPDEPERGVTARTVAFFCRPADVATTITPVAGVDT